MVKLKIDQHGYMNPVPRMIDKDPTTPSFLQN